jgi:CRP/FNR family transcriptional regulator, anaerobic regulatory protein
MNEADLLIDAPREATDITVCAPPLFGPLAEGARLLRRAFLTVPSMGAEPRTVLIEPDTSANGVYLLHSGWARRINDLPDGRRTVLELYLPGDIVGLDTALHGRSAGLVESLSLGSCRKIDGRTFERLLTDARVALYVSWLLAQEQRRADRLKVLLARMNARERLAALILHLYERLRQHQPIAAPSYSLPLTQQQIADHLGLTVVHVNRTLRRLREEGIVVVDNHLVAIRDLARLRGVASGGLARRPSLPVEPVALAQEDAAGG